MATEKELNAVRNIFRNWPRYDNAENEKLIIGLACAEPGGATAQNIGVVFNRLYNAGRLIRCKEFELEIAADFLSKIPKFQECFVGNKLQVIEVLHKLNLPVTLENIDKNFHAIVPRLGEDTGRSEGYRMFFEKYADYAVEANKSIIDAAHSYGEEITPESIEKYFNDPLIRQKLLKTARARQADAEEQERQTIISNLVGGLKPVVDERGRKVLTTRNGFRVLHTAEIERTKALSLEELRQLRDEKAEKKRLQSMSPAEIRQAVRNNAPIISRYEQLSDDGGAVYYPKHDGNNSSRNLEPILAGDPVELTALTIKRLHRDDLHDVIRRFGADAVNAVLAKGRN